MEPFRSFYDFPEGLAERTGDFPTFPGRERGFELPTAWHPSVDVYEDDGSVFVQMDLPGMKISNPMDTSFNGFITVWISSPGI